MTDAVSDTPEIPKKAGKKPLILGVVLAIAGAAGGYFAVPTGSDSPDSPAPEKQETMIEQLPDIAYVPLDPIIVSIAGDRQFQHLRFRAQLEVDTKHKSDVEKIIPRVIDVLNGYLRALEVADLNDPAALSWLRGQMLRRIEVVAGKDRVRDLLIMEFVLN